MILSGTVFYKSGESPQGAELLPWARFPKIDSAIGTM